MLDIDFDLVFIVKFILCFGVLVILPVWIFNLVELSFLYKLLFTVAGGVGVIIALGGRTLRER